MKKFVLFDHDGVLVDTERWYFEAGQRALAEIGVTVDEAELQAPRPAAFTAATSKT